MILKMTTTKSGVVFSDVHLGGSRTSTQYIKQNLSKYIFDEIRANPPDMLISLGDLTDTTLTYGSDDAIDVTAWMCEVLDICHEFDISLKILEGTPSHDAGQNRWFGVENSKRPIDKQVRLFYGDTLCIEHDEHLGLDILYVPDKLNFDATDTWMDVLTLMKSRGLKKVHYAFMHGAFLHQMPKSPSIHDPDRYLSICEYLVMAGHVHQHTVYEDYLVVPGNYDRDRHGDESKKGFLRFEGKDWKFIENKNAKVYKTIDVRTLDLTDAVSKIKNNIDFPDGSYVRVQHSSDLDISAIMETLRGLNRTFVWSSIKEVTKESVLEDLSKPFEDSAITIDADNITGLIDARLSLTDDDRKIFDELMRRVIDVTK